MAHFERLPLALLMTFAFAALMFVPGVYGVLSGDPQTGRVFIYCATLGCGLCYAVQLAIGNRKPKEDRRALLLTLLFVFVALPFGLAIPVVEVIGNTTVLNAYMDMVSAVTTTALPTYAPDRLTDTMILWRSVVGWAGGLFIWSIALVIFLPMRLGGFEMLPVQIQVFSASQQGRIKSGAMTARFLREALAFFPIYSGLTASVWIFLILIGMPAFDAAIFAMGSVSTAGFLPDGQDLWTLGGGGAEMIVFCALLFALTRRMAGKNFALVHRVTLWDDRELRLALVLIGLVTAVLFVRHFLGAVTVQNTEDPVHLGMAIWGAVFTTLSFLTTTGYVSEGWGAAQNWSGLANSGLILLGCAIIGGGAATTAGGIKLLRVTNLLRHSFREIEQLSSPNRVIGSRGGAFGTNVENAVWAWVFFMFFFVAFSLFFLALTFGGASFEEGLVLTTAALTNTGPVVTVIDGVSPNVLGLDGTGKAALVGAMVLGRVETLAILALFNPDIWRR